MSWQALQRISSLCPLWYGNRQVLTRTLYQLHHASIYEHSTWNNDPSSSKTYKQYHGATGLISYRCLCGNRREFHKSSIALAAKQKNSKKKLRRQIRTNPKKKRNTGDVIDIHYNMTIRDLAEALGKDLDHVYEALCFVQDGGAYQDDDAVIDNLSVIKDIVKKSGFRSRMATSLTTKEMENKDAKREPPDPLRMVKCPPVVTIMGHVDHGKTTLLDALRDTHVVEQEFGGITQHIGAFSVTLPSGESVTFLDTPGHAAFSAMRARGAKVTDIVILVIAADDGVMEQTVESIRHAKNAKVPIVVAINKVDKPGVDIEYTRKGLLSHDIVLEEYGGDVQSVCISALKGTNLDELLETIMALAEILELKSDPNSMVAGYIVESKTDAGRGKLATILVQTGTLKKGSYLVAGTTWAKVRAMFNDEGHPVQVAPPSSPVEVIGWRDLPAAGDEVLQIESEQRVKEIIAWRKSQQTLKKEQEDLKVITEKRAEHDLVYIEKRTKKRQMGYFKRMRGISREKEVTDTGSGPCLSIVLKGDVDGSVEAILDALDTYTSNKCRLDLLHYGIGNVTLNDVELAAAFNGIIFAFNIDVPKQVADLAQEKGVLIQRHNVIYKLFDKLQQELTSTLPPSLVETTVGEANVLQVFTVTDGKKKVPVAGCRCTKGSLNKKMKFKLMRNDEIIHEGSILSLKHFKNEVETIKTDVECGVRFADTSVEFHVGDVLTCYSLNEEKQSIDWEPGFALA